MTRDSIFYKVVSNEDAYSQLLCNLMVRSDDFLGRVLGLFLDKETALRILQSRPEISTQTVLQGCGRPDIVIRGAEICALVEAKWNSKCSLTDNQTSAGGLDGELRGYASYLKKTKEPERWLVFLVPKDYEYHHQINSFRDGLKKAHPDIKTNLVCWEDLLGIMSRIEAPSLEPFVEEFRKLLAEHFGPVVFSQKEIQMLVSKDFASAFRIVRKLEELIDEIRVKAQKDQKYKSAPTSPSDKKDEYGIYFRNAKGKYFLYFGFWVPFFEKEHSALCLAIDDKWTLGMPNLREAFSRGSNGHISRCDEWDVRGIPEDLLKSDDPLEQM